MRRAHHFEALEWTQSGDMRTVTGKYPAQEPFAFAGYRRHQLLDVDQIFSSARGFTPGGILLDSLNRMLSSRSTGNERPNNSCWKVLLSQVLNVVS